MSAQIELRLRGDFDQLSPVLEAGRAILSTIPRVGEDEELCHPIQVAIQEMVTNVIRHGYESDPDGEVVVRLLARGLEFSCEIRDHAKPFDPLSHVYEQAVDGSMPVREGGFGIYFALSVMTSVEYERQGGDNVLMLTRIFDPMDVESLTEEVDAEGEPVEDSRSTLPGGDR
ncbi:MAG: ATP-binding protein [Planctomycetota bacterium]